MFYFLLMLCAGQILIIFLLMWKVRRLTIALQKAKLIEGKEADLAQHRLYQEEAAYVMTLMYEIRSAVAKQEQALHRRALERTQQALPFSIKKLRLLFTEEEVHTIQTFWQHYETYLRKHWLTEKGKIKSVFRGAPHLPNSEYGQMVIASKNILPIFDELLSNLNSSS